MRAVFINTIHHAQQRYDTIGDYWTGDNGIEQIRVSHFKDWRHGALVMVHELVEDILCSARGIKNEDIDKFDMAFKGNEPGDSPEAPYYKEHQFAGAIERLLCNELDIQWHEYEKAIEDEINGRRIPKLQVGSVTPGD